MHNVIIDLKCDCSGGVFPRPETDTNNATGGDKPRYYKLTVTAKRHVAGSKGQLMSELIDLSHPIEDGMITYTGLPGPKITDHLSREASKDHYAEGTTFQIGSIEMVANTGTYIDAPFHRYDDGRDLSQFDLASVANLDGSVFRTVPGTRAITPDHF